MWHVQLQSNSATEYYLFLIPTSMLYVMDLNQQKSIIMSQTIISECSISPFHLIFVYLSSLYMIISI